MNKQIFDILMCIKEYKTSNEYKTFNQRELARVSGYSLGAVNQAVKKLNEDGLIDSLGLTGKAEDLLKTHKTKTAILLAAGYGMRMVPVNNETPKPLIKIKGDTIIERQIKHLQSVGVVDIYVVVGYMKEKFEFLIDRYGVKLVINRDYKTKNNLHSMYEAIRACQRAGDIGNSLYVVPCDVYCENNPYKSYELYSWYMVTDEVKNSDVRVNRKQELIAVDDDEPGNKMIGIAHLCDDGLKEVLNNIIRLGENSRSDGFFWEEALYDSQRKKMLSYAREISSKEVFEINTYEELRSLDKNSLSLKSDVIDIIADGLRVKHDEITNIRVLKKGMTNRSFIFNCQGESYIMRIPGEGTEELIDRKQEADVYFQIKDANISDDIIYINPESGYKITRLIEGARNADAYNDDDLRLCMKKLREFHSFDFKVNHTFDIFGQINYYEELWDGRSSSYDDYDATKKKVFELKDFIDSCKKEYKLTHIDAVPDNFVITDNDIRLIDWEYAGMQDPHVDIAMFCIYSLYEKDRVDKLIDIYFENKCDLTTRCKIYCYIASAGLLWSNWCEYKAIKGIEFGEYSLRQYRYAKDYYTFAKELMKDLESEAAGNEK